LKNTIIAEEELIIEDRSPEWHLESELTDTEYLVDFSITKRIVFKMGNGKSYYFSLVRVEE